MSIREDDAAVEDGADDLQKSTSSADKSSERCDLPFTQFQHAFDCFCM